MDFSAIPLFNIAKSKLNYLSERQAVLAQNVSNADTPGYKANDVVAPDFKKLMGGGAGMHMTVTDPKHMASGSGQNGIFKVEKRKSTYELNPNGNNVVIEEEMSKVASNQAEYQKVLNLYGKTISMFKMALGNAGNGG